MQALSLQVHQLSSIATLYIPIALGALLFFSAGDGENQGGQECFLAPVVQKKSSSGPGEAKALEALKR